MKTVVHINQHVLRANRKTGSRNPPVTVKTYKSNIKCKEVEFDGKFRLRYEPDHPLSCKATVWIETLNGECEVTPKIKQGISVLLRWKLVNRAGAVIEYFIDSTEALDELIDKFRSYTNRGRIEYTTHFPAYVAYEKEGWENLIMRILSI